MDDELEGLTLPKMRGFKAEIWTDDKFVELSPLARLLFMGMWSYSCDNGHLDDKPKQIKMRVLPTDDVDPVTLIDQMVDLGMVRRDKAGLTIPKLREHQRIDDRYFTWCDRCKPDEIPEKSRSRHAAATQGAHVSTSSAHGEPTLKEGEGRKEGEGELVEFERPAGRSRKKPSRRLPDDWAPTDEHKARCVQDGINLDDQVAKFRAHAEANDRRQANWNATFTQWLLNVPEWQRGLRTARPSQPFPTDGTEAEKDAWVKAQPLPTDGAYYGGSRR